MFRTKPTAAFILSAIIAILTMVASAGGLFIEELYRDNAFATSAWRGTDLATLVIAVPILIAALLLSLRGSPRAQLVWLGMLDYTLYNYAYYLFSTAFNRFFLIYVALLTLSLFALIFGLAKVNVKGICQKFRARTPIKWIAGYMLFVAVGIGGLWIAQSLSFRHRAGPAVYHRCGPSNQRGICPGPVAGGVLSGIGRHLAVEASALGLCPGRDFEHQGRRVHAGPRCCIGIGNKSRFSKSLGRAALVGVAQPWFSGGESVSVGECAISPRAGDSLTFQQRSIEQ